MPIYWIRVKKNQKYDGIDLVFTIIIAQLVALLIGAYFCS